MQTKLPFDFPKNVAPPQPPLRLGKSKFRIIGDVHGKHSRYRALTSNSESSLQLGDMGFSYRELSAISPWNHKFFGGNHDNYDTLENNPPAHCLGNFGYHQSPIGGIFYIRGAFSIDKRRRMPYVDWWPQEQLSVPQLNEALVMYLDIKPRYVVTHEAPQSLIPELVRNKGWKIFKTWTANALQAMFEEHQPERWWFGHHHKSWSKTINGTHFRCLAELEYEDFRK